MTFDKAITQSDQIWGGKRESLLYLKKYQNYASQVEDILRNKIDCPCILDKQQKLKDQRDELRNLLDQAKLTDFFFVETELSDALDEARKLINGWNELQQKLAANVMLFNVATALLTPLDTNLKTRLDDARLRVLNATKAGNFEEAQEYLNQAILAAKDVCLTKNKGKFIELQKSFTEQESDFLRAKSIVPGCQIVESTQREFLEYYSELNTYVNKCDERQASRFFGLTLKSAYTTIELHEHYEGFCRDESRFIVLCKTAGFEKPEGELEEKYKKAKEVAEVDPQAARELLNELIKEIAKIAVERQRYKAQEQRSEELKKTFGKMLTSYLPAGGANNLRLNGALANDDNFKTFLEKLQIYENFREIRTYGFPQVRNSRSLR